MNTEPPLFILVILVLFLLSTGCTTAAWMVDADPVTDADSEQVISENRFLYPDVTPTPQNPVLSLEYVIERDLKYDQRLVSKRYIQRYRPRYGYLALGLSGMGLGLYLANTSVIDADKLSGRERALLNLAAVSIGTASFLNMKPIGEPRTAGEERLLQKTGTIVHNDTIPANIPEGKYAAITVMRDGEVLVSDDERALSGNRLILDLVKESGFDRLEEADTSGLQVQIQLDGNEYNRYFPVSDFMQKYVEITASNTPVRTAPATLSNNIIRHVGSESQFPYLRDIDDRWHQLLKSGGSAYVHKDHSKIIWISAGVSDSETLVMQADQAYFGDLEVERNLPDNRRANADGIAIVIVNGAYDDPVRTLPHASRTGELVSLYLNHVLGFYSDNILVYENMDEQEMRTLLHDSDSLLIGGRHLSRYESDLFFYYYGHSFSDENEKLYLLPVDYDPADMTEKRIPFDEVLPVLGNLRSRKSIVVMDTDWSRQAVFGQPERSNVRSRVSDMERKSAPFLEMVPNSAIFWAASPGQIAGTYSGANGRTRYPYDIFTWYFFKALKEGAQTVGDVEQYLERHVPFTSRRLHDTAQDPGIFGNKNLYLIEE